MLRVEDPNALFSHAPSCFVRERFLAAMITETLQWIALWGRVTEGDYREFETMLEAEYRHAGPHVTLVDSRGLESVEPKALLRLVEGLRRVKVGDRKTTMREAHVRPPGFGGVIVAGYVQVFSMPYPCRVFDEGLPALEWLGVPNPAQAVAVGEGLTDAARNEGGALVQLRRLLDEQLRLSSEEDAARALGTSVRTLQRKLEVGNTTFRTELVNARMRRAMVLLRETDRPLKNVAEEVGVPSLSQFSEQFRRVAGVPPGQWREAARKR